MIQAPTSLSDEQRENLLASRQLIKFWVDRYPELLDIAIAFCYYQFRYEKFLEYVNDLHR